MDKTRGHAAAIITIFVWGVTFISTKILLTGFLPVEILFCRFVIGYLALFAICPRLLPYGGLRQEAYFVAAGLTGICLYYLLENIALTYTLASNVGVLLCTAPFFTALAGFAVSRGKERPHRRFIFGFVLAMAGIYLISTAESGMQFNLTGDILALSAAAVWALYAVLTRKITTFGYNTILITRHIFFYGLLFMLPALYIFGFTPDLTRFYNPAYLFNILFLGLGASAMCFVTWNYAVKVLGAVKTSAYIYAVPVLTVASAVIVLNEPVTVKMLAGGVLIILGFCSRKKRKTKIFIMRYCLQRIKKPAFDAEIIRPEAGFVFVSLLIFIKQ